MISLGASCINPSAYSDPKKASLSLAPPVHIAIEVGESFDIAISISNVEDLVSAKLYVTYNTSILDVTQVLQGSFFPLPPKANFESSKNESSGFIKINASLSSSETPRSGNGTLAWLRFKVISEAKPGFSSPLDFEQTMLVNSHLNPIDHDIVGAVYFWKYAGSFPTEPGRTLDLYTQKGGIGPDEPGGNFMVGAELVMISRVTYNNDPVRNKLVNFALRNPLGQSAGFRSAMTDENGLAIVIFGIPEVSSSYGTWTAISVVNIVEKTVWDTLVFQVSPRISVGGHTTSLGGFAAEKSFSFYLAALVMLTAVWIITKRCSTHAK